MSGPTVWGDKDGHGRCGGGTGRSELSTVLGRAAGGDEKIRKYLQAVLVIGGTALVPGMAHALESR